MKMRAVWDIAPCSLVGADGRLRGAYCLHHQGRYLPDYTVLYTRRQLSLRAVLVTYVSRVAQAV
jgi:hypothetical protein